MIEQVFDNSDKQKSYQNNMQRYNSAMNIKT